VTGGLDQAEFARLVTTALDPLVRREGAVVAERLCEEFARRGVMPGPAGGVVDHEARKSAEILRLQHDQHTVECARRYGEIAVALDRLSTSVSRIHGRINGYLIAVLGGGFVIILGLVAAVFSMMKGG